MEKFGTRQEVHGKSLGSNDERRENPNQCTREELRKLYNNALGIDENSTWKDIDRETEKGLNEGELPSTQCFFDLESGTHECYQVPKTECSELD